jgi:hypothetical protein
MSVRPINFKSSCVKTLSAVEAMPSRSNQHEFNGVVQLKEIFGTTKIQLDASFSVRGEDEVYKSSLTWYDAREANATRSEFRLYFQSNPVMARATRGDNIIIGFDSNNNIHCELISQGTQGYNRTNGWVVQV